MLRAGARWISQPLQHGYQAVAGVDDAALVARDLRARVPLHRLLPMIKQLDIPAEARTPEAGAPTFVKLRLTR